jgi:hypothetical protein
MLKNDITGFWLKGGVHHNSIAKCYYNGGDVIN